MKNIEKAGLSVLGMLLVYLLSAFIAWEANPGLWAYDLRVFSAAMMFFCFLGYLIVKD